jgi:recombination protein RecA
MSVTLKKKEDLSASSTSRLAGLDQLAKEMPLFSEEDYVTSTKITPSGSLALDLAIGLGGYPSGCIIDTFGGESAGKSLLSIMAMAQVQRAGGVAVVWDVERSYSKNTGWLKVNGVDPSKLRFIKLRPEQGCEIGMDAVEKIAGSGLADLIVVDSIPAMVTQAQLAKAMSDNDMVSARANAMTRHLNRLVSIIDTSKTTVLFINQLRANMGAGMYESKEKETSIFALKHASSLRMQVTKLTGKDNIKMVDGVPVGHRVKVKMVKNKLAAPYKIAEFDIYYNSGVDVASEIADILIGAGVIKVGGSWYDFDGQHIQGLKKVTDFIREPKNLEKYLKQAKAMSDKLNNFGGKPAEPGVVSVDSLNVEEGED